MRYLSYALLLGIGLVLQVGLLRFATILGVAPDLLLVATVVVALRRGQVAGMVFGFLAGLGVDLATSSVVGLSALSKTVVGFVAGLWSSDAVGLSRSASVLLLLLCATLHELLMAAALALTPGAGFGFLLLRWALPRTVYTLVVGLVVFLLLPEKVWHGRATTLFRGAL
ncbi:MAG: rod shape-determining protein MreD [candidate division KSB1 bacterium]|nr:rod shape-determining protein MreD [candidate division KSB1 bacterium]MDZ7377717.1 rod shape-determining protein MreD [candidate division KSB1 bacterium]MDZ7385161.1 rod shape-determining protein MreD [candidate division KSB1 bacterium]MDZ7391589.1 rod shape-determining protein MreD [candidate division KSB1 bacterium]MDZ7413274.1 rod shape-determining protein MreD [candidate division KSB1 bacterium]